MQHVFWCQSLRESQTTERVGVAGRAHGPITYAEVASDSFFSPLLMYSFTLYDWLIGSK